MRGLLEGRVPVCGIKSRAQLVVLYPAQVEVEDGADQPCDIRVRSPFGQQCKEAQAHTIFRLLIVEEELIDIDHRGNVVNEVGVEEAQVAQHPAVGLSVGEGVVEISSKGLGGEGKTPLDPLIV